MLTQNPKTDTEEIRGKLGQKSGRGDEDDAQEGSYGRADRGGTAAGSTGSTRRRGLPQGGDQPGDVLSVETKVYRGASPGRSRDFVEPFVFTIRVTYNDPLADLHHIAKFLARFRNRVASTCKQ